eukprot:11191188-Lingulodinium_polyedra.AAC.1
MAKAATPKSWAARSAAPSPNIATNVKLGGRRWHRSSRAALQSPPPGWAHRGALADARPGCL